MGILGDTQTCETLKVRFQEDICFIQIHRPDANNTINDRLIEEFIKVLDLCEKEIKIIVLEGLPEVFCFGADFKAIQQGFETRASGQVVNPEPRSPYPSFCSG